MQIFIIENIVKQKGYNEVQLIEKIESCAPKSNKLSCSV